MLGQVEVSGRNSSKLLTYTFLGYNEDWLSQVFFGSCDSGKGDFQNVIFPERD